MGLELATGIICGFTGRGEGRGCVGGEGRVRCMQAGRSTRV